MNKRIILMSAAIVSGGLATTLGTAGITNAATMNSTATTHKEARANKRLAHEEAKLTKAVTDGVITEAQKTAFLSEIKSVLEANKGTLNKTSTKAQREAEHSKVAGEIQSWSVANNFPLAKVFPKLAS